ncbi:hypothetical protein C1646_773809 [Rhizophagus diaphanus]|nr:hypothetical protein C1646_773809 [Rhizophagus diaphanus] [Rhizophagus sp. MUCL 43196]
MTTNKRKGGRLQNEVWKHYTQGERHIANYCPNAPPYLIRKYQKIFKEKADKNNKKRRVFNQTSLDDYHDTDKPLPQGRIDRINRALLKFFVCCRISFRVVESLFFIDFINELNIVYDPLSRKLLANRLFEDELGNINSKIYKELQMSDNLMLGEYIAEKIEDVINRVGVSKFSAIVSDNVQHPFADKLLKKVNILAAFFRNNAKASGLPHIEMASNYLDLLTNDRIKPIICSWNFFNKLKVLGFVLNPLCKAVLALERREVDLSDCYLELAQRLESMLKLITYYRSNTSHELAFYGKDTKRNLQKFSDSELNTIINEIKNTLELSNPKILNGLENVREFPEEKGEEANDNMDGNNQNNNEVAGRGILNYNVDDLAKKFED